MRAFGRILALLDLAIVTTTTAQAQSQALYPNKPTLILIPYGPGEMQTIFEKGGIRAPTDKSADEARAWLKHEMETWRRDIADAEAAVNE